MGVDSSSALTPSPFPSSPIASLVYVLLSLIPPILANDETVRKFLKKEALKIPLEQFEGDQVLFQRWADEDGSTHYWHPKFHDGKRPVYERKTNDLNASAVVLKKNEDLLESHGGPIRHYKQTYVILRRYPNTNDFFPFFAYLRNARQNEICTLTMESDHTKKCVEWDSWELRTVEEPVIWKDCSSSVFLSCGFNVSVFGSESEYKAIVPVPNTEEAAPIVVPPSPTNQAVVNEDFTNITDYDFFDDIQGRQRPAMKGRTMGAQAQGRALNVDILVCVGLLGPACSKKPQVSNAHTQAHPIQYTHCSCEKDPRLAGKANYKNYMPLRKVEMTPYRIALTSGTFNPEDTQWPPIKGKMYVFGPGHLDVFKSDTRVFGKSVPDDRGTLGTYSAEKSSDPNSMLNGVLIPIDPFTAYLVRFGLSYPATFSTPAGIPDTRGFVIPINSKNIDLFYPDSFVYNNLMLNQPLETPLEGKIQPIAQWSQEKDWVQKGLLLPRRHGPSILIRSAKPSDIKYGKFDGGKGFPVKVLIVPGAEGRADSYYSVNEPLPPAKEPIRGKVTYQSPAKTVNAIGIPATLSGDVDHFVPDDASQYTVGKGTCKFHLFLENEKCTYRLPSGVGAPLEIYLPPDTTPPVPAVISGSVVLQDQQELQGQIYIDKPSNAYKFVPKSSQKSASKIPPGDVRYPTYVHIGSNKDTVKYNIRDEIGSFTPDDESLAPFQVKIFVLGVDRLDIVVGHNKDVVFGKGKGLLPEDKGTAGVYVALKPTPTSIPLHGVLIPMDSKTGALVRDGIGYPGTFKPKPGSVISDTLGFYMASLKQNSDFFVPDSFITWKTKEKSPYKPIEGQVNPDPHLASMFSPSKGKLLPRMNSQSIFIPSGLKGVEGSFQDDNKQIKPAGSIFMIPGTEGKPDEFYPLDDILPESKTPDTLDPVSGTISLPNQKIPATLIPGATPQIPDILEPSEKVETKPITFLPTDKKMKPFHGHLIKLRALPFPIKMPVEVQFTKNHGQPYPSKVIGVLKPKDGKETRGLVMFNTPRGPYTFYPAVMGPASPHPVSGGTSSNTEENEDKQGGKQQPKPNEGKYPKYRPFGKGEAVGVMPGVTVGNFVPDTENGKKPVRIALHATDRKVHRVEAEEPLFGRELPSNRATEGTYTPEDKKASKKASPMHGLLVPISKYRAYFIPDGIGYQAKFTPQVKNVKPTIGFVVPSPGKKIAKEFYPETFIPEPFPDVKQPVLEGKLTGEKPVETLHPAEEGRFLVRRELPCVFIPNGFGDDGQFQDKQRKLPPKRVIVIPKGEDSEDDEFYPIDDLLPDGSEPVQGTIKTPENNYDVTAVPSGVADELRPSSELKPQLITISSKEDDVKNVKGYALVPPGQKGAPKVPTQLTITEGAESMPPRMQATLTMPDKSTADGLLVADSPTGPHTFYPGMTNPSPASKKDDDGGPKRTKPDPKKPIKKPKPQAGPTDKQDGEGSNMYPSYKPQGTSDESLKYHIGTTNGTFVEDDAPDKKYPATLYVLGVDKLDVLEFAKPVFGKDIPDFKATVGTYTPSPGKKSPQGPMHGVILPVDDKKAMFIRDNLGSPVKVEVPEKDVEFHGFLVPQIKRPVDLIYPDSIKTFGPSAVKMGAPSKAPVPCHVTPDDGVVTLSPTDGKIIPNKQGENIFLSPDDVVSQGTFKSDDDKVKVGVTKVEGKDGLPDEYHAGDAKPLKELESPATGTIALDGEDEQPEATVVSVPKTKDEDVIYKIFRKDVSPLKNVEITTQDKKLNKVPAYMAFPTSPTKPPKPMDVIFKDFKVPFSPSMIPATATVLDDNSQIQGALQTTGETGPHLFHPSSSTGKVPPKKLKPGVVTGTANMDPNEPPWEISGGTSNPPKNASKPTVKETDAPDEEVDEDETERYPTYKPISSNNDPVEYVIGEHEGKFVPDDKGSPAFPAKLFIGGVDKLDVLEASSPVFGDGLSTERGTAGTYKFKSKENPNAIHGVLLPVTETQALLVRDHLGFPCKLYSKDDEAHKTPGFLIPSMKQLVEFYYPDSYMSNWNPPQEETEVEIIPEEKVRPTVGEKLRGKLIPKLKGASIFIRSELKPEDATFQRDDKKDPDPLPKVLYVPGQGDKADELYPVGDVVPGTEDALVPGSVVTKGDSKPVIVIPVPDPDSPDVIVPRDAKDIIAIILKTPKLPAPVKGYALLPKDSPRPPTLPFEVVPSQDKLPNPSKQNADLTFDDDKKKVKGPIIVVTDAGPHTMHPLGGSQDTGDEPDIAGLKNKKSNYPDYKQFGTTEDPIQYVPGVTKGIFTPDDSSISPLPVILNVPGIDKLDIMESETPIFGNPLPNDKATPGTYAEEGGKRSEPIHGLVVPINERMGYLVRDGVAYTASFSEKNNEPGPISGFAMQSLGNTREAELFVPESFFGFPEKVKSKLVLEGVMVPDQEVAEYLNNNPGKLLVHLKSPSTFIPDDGHAVTGTFKDDAGKLPPRSVSVIPSDEGKPMEIYPIDDILPPETAKPVLGKVTIPDSDPIPASVVPQENSPDIIIPEENGVPKPVLLSSKEVPLEDVIAYLIYPKGSKGPPKKPTDLILTKGKDKVPSKAAVSIRMPEDNSTGNGLLVATSPDGPHTYFPGLTDPTKKNDKNTPGKPAVEGDDEDIEFEVSGSQFIVEDNVPITMKEPGVAGQANKRPPPTPSKHPEYVQYGTSDKPVDYLTGVTTGSVLPENGKNKRYPAVMHCVGIDRLDVIETDEPIFGKDLPNDKGTLATYTPAEGKSGSGVRGVLVPIDERRALLVRDSIAYTGTFVPDDDSVEPVTGFAIQTLTYNRAGQFFVPDSFIKYKQFLEKEAVYQGSLVPDKEVEDFFVVTPGQMLTRPLGPSVFISESVNFDEGSFEDDKQKVEPKKLAVILGENGNNEYYPMEDVIPQGEEPVLGSITTSDNMLPVVAIPVKNPKLPDQILNEEQEAMKPLNFTPTVKIDVNVIKAFTPGPKKDMAKLLSTPPQKPLQVTVVNLDFEKWPLNINAKLNLPNGAQCPGLLASNSPYEPYYTFYPGVRSPKEVKAEPGGDEMKPTNTNSSKPISNPYPTYVPLGVSPVSLEYQVGPTTGSFVEDAKPTKPYPCILYVLGVDKLDVLKATNPIFGQELPDKKAIPGTYTPDPVKPSGQDANKGKPQKPLHGVLLVVSVTTAFFVRDGLGYPVSLRLPDKNVDQHGFFVPLLKRPVELFYADSILAFEPTIDKISEPGSNEPIPNAIIVPDVEVEPMFSGANGKIILDRRGPNVFINKDAPLLNGVYTSDDGTATMKLSVAEGNNGLPNEYFPVDRPGPEIPEPKPGTISMLSAGPKKPPKDVRVNAVSLPKADAHAQDDTQYKIYPEDTFIIKRVEVTSKDKKKTLKKVPGILVAPKSSEATTPMDLIIPSQPVGPPATRIPVSLEVVDEDSIMDGQLGISCPSGPHTFFPGKTKPKGVVVGGANKNITSPDDPTWELSGGTPNDAQMEEPGVAGHANTKPPKKEFKPPTPLFATQDDDWPSNLAYEPTGEGGADGNAVKPQDSSNPKQPEKAVQAVILPFDSSNGVGVKGKIPPTSPTKGKEIYFIPFKNDQKDNIDYYRGYLRIPGNPDGDVSGRLDPPTKASMPPVFVVDPEGAEPATFTANDNPRQNVYGYLLKSDKQLKFRPDSPAHEPNGPTPGVIKQPGVKTNLVGILMKPVKSREPSDFVTQSNNNNTGDLKDAPAYFYPDVKSMAPIKGKMKKQKGNKEFTPDDMSKFDKNCLPLHGFLNYDNFDIPPEAGFLKPAGGENLPFETEPDNSTLAEFRPDTPPDTVIKGLLLPPENTKDASRKFLPSSQAIKPKDNDYGIMEKLNSGDAPMVGSIKVDKNDIYFVPDKKNTIQVSFYPDLEAEPTEGTYVLPKTPGNPGEFRPSGGSEIPAMLPSPGQLIPKVPNEPQKHGVLKRNDNNKLVFVEDPPGDKPPEFEVGLYPLRNERQERLDISTMSVSVRGSYYSGISNITIFIPMSGAIGQLVANKLPPSDPNAMKFDGMLTPHDVKTTSTGESYKLTFAPDYGGPNNNPATDFESGTQVVFFPLGSLIGGISGRVERISDFKWAFLTEALENPGKWKPPSGVQEFMFDEKGQIVPYDASLIWFKQKEREAMAGKKVKGGYYKGAAGVNVIIPEGAKTGSNFMLDEGDVFHGQVYPLGKGETLRFVPDNEASANGKVREKGGKVTGKLDPDESLSSNGKTPDNGIICTMELNAHDELIITPEQPGKWGFFVPGKRGTPRIVVMVFEVYKADGGDGAPTSLNLNTQPDDDTFGVVGVGRTFAGDSGSQKKMCASLKQAYFVHEEENLVVLICRKKKSKNSTVTDPKLRTGYYPYVEVNDEDTDDMENVRAGSAYRTSTGAQLFVSNQGIKGEFRVKEAGKSGLNVESMVKIPGTIHVTPSTKKLVFKPDDLALLIEEVQGTSGVPGFFKTTIGVGEEGLISGTLSTDRKSTVGKLIVDRAGEFGLVFLTGKERVVAGRRGAGRSFEGAAEENYMGKVHGIMFDTGGTGTFLPQQPDVSAVFVFESAAGNQTEENVLYNPQFQLIYTESSFSNLFKQAIKQNRTLKGKLYIEDINATIPASLSKSMKVPMAYVFSPSVSFKTGWLATRKEGDVVEVFFLNDDAIDVYSHPGWITQYMIVEPGITKTQETRIFYGMGNCPFDPNTGAKDFKKSFKSEDDVILFFLRVLRTHCLRNHFNQVKQLLKLEILETAEMFGGVVLRMNRSNPLLSAQKLTRNQTGKISSAFEISVFSQVYAEQLTRQNLEPSKAPDGGIISRSSYFFMKMVAFAIKRAKEVAGHHFVRLMRNMLTTLNTAITKLDQDRERIDNCKECGEDILQIHNDKKMLIALSQFITNHVRYVVDADSEARFKEYYKTNKHTISKLAAKKYTYAPDIL